LVPEFIATDWRIGADPAAIEARLREDKGKQIKAVCFLHNETSTGCLSPVAEIRKAIDRANHPALLMVDTISSLASTDYRHDEWHDNVFARHDSLAEATRRAIRAWNLEIICRDPKYYSPTITAVLLPEGHDADAFRALALEQFNISYGASFGRFNGKMFRIGH